MHIEHWSTFVTTPEATTLVHVASAVENQSDAARNVALEIALIAPDGITVGNCDHPIAKRCGRAKQPTFAAGSRRATPELWDLDHPALYRAVVQRARRQERAG